MVLLYNKVSVKSNKIIEKYLKEEKDYEKKGETHKFTK